MKKFIAFLMVLVLVVLHLTLGVGAVDASTADNDLNAVESLATASYVSTATIPDGVYRIMTSGSMKYLTVHDYGYTDFTSIDCKTYISYDTDMSQLWKVTNIGSGYYSIRPLNKPNMGLDVTGTNVDLYSIGINDSTGIINDAKWKIQQSTVGNSEYYIQNYTYSNRTLTFGDNGIKAHIDSFYGHGDQRWMFEPVTVASKISIYGKSYLNVNQSTTLTAGVYSSNTLNQSVTWSSTSSNVTVSSNGTVTAKSAGMARIKAVSTIDSSCLGLFDIYVGSYGSKSVGLVGVPSTGHDHATVLSIITTTTYLGGIYSYSSIVRETNGMTTYSFLELAAATPITIIRSHGTQNRVLLNETSIPVEEMYTSSLQSMQGRPLDDSELILYLCCLTGQGGRTANNIVNQTFNAGAKFVIGFQEKIACVVANDWLKNFCMYLRFYDQNDYKKAIDHARDYTLNAQEGALNSYFYRHINEG